MAAQVGIAPIKQRGVATLGGTEKVAALLLAMGRQAAASVLQQFEPQEIRIVTKAAAELRPITAQELEGIVEEFAQQFSMGANILGTSVASRPCLATCFRPTRSRRSCRTCSAIRADRLGSRLVGVGNSLASYLSKEHPTDRGAHPVQGQAVLRCQGHEPVAIEPAQRTDAARAQPQADRRRCHEGAREDAA